MSTTTTAYGSITIVDITDIGEFSIYPMSNSPLSVVYDPNQNVYTPDWSSNNLVLQPMIYYAGKKLDFTTTGLTVVWKRKDGNSAETDLKTGEVVNNNILTVSANNLGTSNAGMLTYICYVTYEDTETGQMVNITDRMTYTLIKAAENAKTCMISGPQVFI